MPISNRACRLVSTAFLMLIFTASSPAPLWGGSKPVAPAPEQSQAEILKVLHQQVQDWNHGNIEGFMAGYWNSPDLTFYSGGTVTRGWRPTLERYKKRYQGAGMEMGTLTFEGLEVTMLSGDTAMVRGHWRLGMTDGTAPQGLYTLLLRKFPEGWRIVHDHSSVQA